MYWNNEHGCYCYETDLPTLNMLQKRFERHLEMLDIGYGDVVLDVGGYLGRIAHYAFMHLASTVVSYEAYKRNYEVLKASSVHPNFRASNQTHVIINKAIFNKFPRQSSVKQMLVFRNPAFGFVVGNAEGREAHMIETVPLIDAMVEHQPSVIILDTAGGESWLLTHDVLSQLPECKSALIVFNKARGKEISKINAAIRELQSQTNIAQTDNTIIVNPKL